MKETIHEEISDIKLDEAPKLISTAVKLETIVSKNTGKKSTP